MKLPLVAIVGRPNVGKSSLFNRLLGKRIAIVDPTPGVTRDRNYADCLWNGHRFRLIDTGGIDFVSDDDFAHQITAQAEFAIAEADLTVFLVDNQVGINTDDIALARKLSKARRPVLLAVNKADSIQLALDRFTFLNLGLGEPLPISATVGLGIGELLDSIIEKLPSDVQAEPDPTVRVAIVGRPNVGKSSLINKLLGENRLIVSEIAGTTRDAVDSELEVNGRRFTLVDTAGMRKKSKVAENIEFYTSLRTTRAIELCDVAVLMIDGSTGITTQDQRILGQVFESRRAAVLVVNKWDLVEKDSKTADQYTKAINLLLAKHAFLPIIYVSALSGQRVGKILDLVHHVHEQHQRRVGTSELNQFLERTLRLRKPPATDGKFIQIKYVTQSETAPPTFVFFCSHAKLLDKSYIQFLSNQLREKFGFSGVPIRLKFRYK